MKKISFLVVFLLCSNFIFSQPVLFQPFNLDFEEGTPPDFVPGWTLTKQSSDWNYYIGTNDYEPFEGRYTLEIGNYNIEEKEKGMIGSAFQSLDAVPYRGKKIRISAAVRTMLRNDSAAAYLFAVEHLLAGGRGNIEQMHKNPIKSDKWQVYTIELDVAENASKVNFGVMLKSIGRVWVDNFKISIITKEELKAEAPKKLNENEIENLKILANAYGNIQYFSPASEALNTDWDSFAHFAVKNIESAENKDSLINKLNFLFEPIVPMISFSNPKDAKSQKKNIEKPRNAVDNIAYSIMHLGMPTKSSTRLYRSSTANIYRSQHAREAVVFQTVDVSNLIGKKAILKVAAKTEAIGVGSHAQLWLRIDKKSNKDEDATMIAMEKPIDTKDWTYLKQEITIPIESQNMKIGLVFIGDGKAYFDDVKLEFTDEKGNKVDAKLINNSFELTPKDNLIEGWEYPKSVTQFGYSVNVTNEKSKLGSKSLMFASDTSSYINYPNLGEMFSSEIADNLVLTFPVNVYSDGTHTLPFSETRLVYPQIALDANDRVSRLVIAMNFWNYLKHFSLMDFRKQELDSILTQLLIQSSLAQTEDQFTLILKKASIPLKDAQFKIWQDKEVAKFALPFLLSYTNNKLFVSKTHNSFKVINAGDEILAINGENVSNLISEAKQRIPHINPKRAISVAIAELRAGMKDEIVQILYKKSNGETANIEVAKSIGLSDLTEYRPNGADVLDTNGYFYFDMVRVGDKDFLPTIDDLLDAKGIVFDIRGTSKMSEYTFSLLTDTLLKSIQWDTYSYTKPEKAFRKIHSINSTIKAFYKKLSPNIVFLTDERSIGYSEGILHLAKYYGIGKTLGKESAGSPGETAPLRLGGNYNLTATFFKGKLPNGETIYQKTIKPDYEFTETEENLSNYDELLIEEALKILKTNAKK